jgi:hypothetical protein
MRQTLNNRRYQGNLHRSPFPQWQDDPARRTAAAWVRGIQKNRMLMSFTPETNTFSMVAFDGQKYETLTAPAAALGLQLYNASDRFMVGFKNDASKVYTLEAGASAWVARTISDASAWRQASMLPRTFACTAAIDFSGGNALVAGVNGCPVDFAGTSRVLLCAEYTTAAGRYSTVPPRLLACFVDSDGVGGNPDPLLFYPLITTAVSGGYGAISHFHGLVIVNTWLVCLTGDSSGTGAGPNETSMLVCTDIADLFQNPTTWKTNWGLDLVGTDRGTYLAGAGAAYTFDWTTNGFTAVSQNARAVDVIADEDGETLVWIIDSGTTDRPCMSVAIGATPAASVVSRVGTTHMIGTGWVGCYDPVSRMWIIGTCSEANAAASGLNDDGSGLNNDSNVRLYGVYREPTAGTLTTVLLKSVARLSTDPITGAPGTVSTRRMDTIGIVAGNVYARINSNRSGAQIMVPQTDEIDVCGRPYVARTYLANLCANPRFETNSTGWAEFLPTATPSRVTDVKPTGYTASLKVVHGDDDTNASIVYTFPAASRTEVLGRLVTVAFRLLLPANYHANLVPTFGLINNAGTFVQLFRASRSADWQDMVITVPIPPSVSDALYFLFRTNDSANGGTAATTDEANRTLWIADVRIIRGGPVLAAAPWVPYLL